MKIKWIEERFNEYDKRPHTDYRLIAKYLAYDYHKLSNKYKKALKEIDELKSKLKEKEVN